MKDWELFILLIIFLASFSMLLAFDGVLAIINFAVCVGSVYAIYRHKDL